MAVSWKGERLGREWSALGYVPLGKEARTGRAGFLLPPSLLCVHPFRHEALNAPRSVPVVVVVNEITSAIFGGGLDLDLVVRGEVTLAGYVGEEVRYIAECRLLGTNVAI